MEPRSMNVEGIRMHWLEAGEGPPVVLLHGIPTSPRLWRHVVPRLGHVRALAWSLVGFGPAIEHAGRVDLSLQAQAGYLTAWMDALGLGRALIVGHDLGGGVAQILAVRHPGRVAGLVLVNCVAYDSWPIPSVRAMQRAEPLLPRAPNLLVRLALRRGLGRLHDTARSARESFREHWPFYARTKAGRALAHQVHALDNRDTLSIAPALQGLRLPARIVWGTRGVQDTAYAERLARDLNAPLRWVENARHFVPEDHPDRVVEAVHQLQRELWARETPAPALHAPEHPSSP